jgi:hypothetical protein
LTFVTPEDESAWLKLSRQGGLDIREIDAMSFIDDGLWHYKEHRTAFAPEQTGVSAPRRAPGRPKRWQARRRSRTWGAQV